MAGCYNSGQMIEVLWSRKADKGSCVVVWDRNDHLLWAERQLSDKFTEMLVTLKIFSVSYQKQEIKCLVALKEEVF